MQESRFAAAIDDLITYLVYEYRRSQVSWTVHAPILLQHGLQLLCEGRLCAGLQTVYIQSLQPIARSCSPLQLPKYSNGNLSSLKQSYSLERTMFRNTLAAKNAAGRATCRLTSSYFLVHAYVSPMLPCQRSSRTLLYHLKKVSSWDQTAFACLCAL